MKLTELLMEIGRMRAQARQERDRKRREQRERVRKGIETFWNGVNWCGFGILLITLVAVAVSEPPIEATGEDLSVYKVSLIAPFLLYTAVAYMQLKHRDQLPLFKDRSLIKSTAAWVVVFFLGMFFYVSADTLYSDDYKERYAVYQQEQEQRYTDDPYYDDDRNDIWDEDDERQRIEAERQQLEEELRQLEEEIREIEEETSLDYDDAIKFV